MITSGPLRVVFGVGISAAVALVALYADELVPLPEDGFVPGSFITHSVMLVLSAAIMWLWRGRLAEFGFARRMYRFRPIILLWVLPTAILSLPVALNPGGGDGSEMMEGRTELQLIIFVWIYASICEEVLTRGLLQTLISRGGETGIGRPSFSMPVVVSGLFFGAMHLMLIKSMGLEAIPAIILATLLGFLAARYRQATGSLIPAVIVHVLFNVGGMLPGWVVRWVT
jgi:membrane protease YdiL (CAAX protease family)